MQEGTPRQTYSAHLHNKVVDETEIRQKGEMMWEKDESYSLDNQEKINEEFISWGTTKTKGVLTALQALDKAVHWDPCSPIHGNLKKKEIIWRWFSQHSIFFFLLYRPPFSIVTVCLILKAIPMV